jgi:biotin carboxyl carrier protein
MALHKLLCPLPGTFYRKPAPDADPYVKEGDRVAPGDTVGLVEVMKQFNEIKADAAGTVLDFLVENEGTVEPGQPLMTIEQ